MHIEFYGVRGSIATAGEATRRYGGNTSCVAVEVAGEQLIFDAGTGIRALGGDLGRAGGAERTHVNLFFSHLHWDHIQGFPFFGPAYVPGNRIDLWHVRGAPGQPDLRTVLDEQMRAPTFPVGLDMMRAELCFHELGYGQVVRVGEAQLRHVAVDHPNGCVAWRVDHPQSGASLVYATDLEHDADALPEDLVALCRGADLLIWDAMYTPEEYAGVGGASRKGWGHSTFEVGAALAERAGIGRLCLFHHDPSHDDGFMDALAARARRRLAGTIVAAEGVAIELGAPSTLLDTARRSA
ncbi:MBL fold metallo-hydrolase [Pseudenhygromyxa sp. WMMC2535]|uniref:MBL fold metallo-hydrolase n=1 Tax=Pseudenhygromyxa sp. WMMC2535 TaxID=2712867 RepID=UPI001556CE05|nr:MBL fold metallo-hydrolase [Pseudenhygromyxa sp. WMMC2535]NVB42880.1 MBL fold metallo-hydrolase [Pseudenhygromyxa sp. WMMC2535]